MIHSAYKNIKQFFVPILVLFLTAGMVFLPSYAPVLFMDDWWTFGDLNIFGGLSFIDLANRRPLLNAVEKVLLGVFGLNLKALYYADYFVIFLCAVVVFFLARRIFRSHPFLALPAALLFLVFPADQTRQWVSINYQWINFLATLIAFYLLLDYAETGRGWKLAVSLPLVLIPVFAYEGQLGIVTAWSLLLAIFFPRIPRKRRLLLLSPIGVVAIFAFWRFFFQPVVLNLHDPYMQFQSKPDLIKMFVTRAMRIFPVYIDCWVQPFSYLLGISTNKTMLVMAGAIAGIGLLALWVSKEYGATGGNTHVNPGEAAGARSPANPGRGLINRSGWMEKKRETVQLLWIGGAGIVMLLAGYVPNLIIITPTLEWFGSRGNMLASFGAVLALTALFALIGLWISTNRSQMRILVMAVMIPFILMGATEQMWNQKEAREAWVEQKHFWRALFTAVPNLRDGATLVVAMPHGDPERPFQRLPFTAYWELTGGLKVLYNNPNLSAVPFTPNHAEANGYGKLVPEGLRIINGGLIPYDKLVIVYYEQGSYQVKIVPPENGLFPLDFALTGYDPAKYLLPDPPSSTPYRGLVVP